MNSCNICGNIMTYGENHTCSFLTIDSTYSHSQPFSENTSDSGQEGTPRQLPSFGIFSHLRLSYNQTNINVSSTGFSENSESWHRPENDFPEPFNTSRDLTVSTDVGEEDQRGSGISDMIHAAGRAEDEMSRQEYRWLSWNNDKINCIDSAESVNRTNPSNNSNVSALRNLLLNSDLLPRRNVRENDQTHVSEYVNDGHTSLGMHSNLYSNSEKTAISVKENISSETVNNAATILSGSNESEKGRKRVSEYVTDGHYSLEMDSNLYSKSRKMASTVKEHISSKTDNNAVAGPSGMCPRKKKYPCTLCPMEFDKKSHFDSHLLTHTGEKPFVCEFCGKGFSEKGNRKVHIRTHTGEKPFVCEFCENVFARKCTLDAHIRTHTGETPFVCEVCEKAFARKCTLDAHIRTHTGEKPYECPVCGNAFTTSGSRNRHLRNVHK